MDGSVPDVFAAFVLAATVIALTPGPNMAWPAIVAASEGRRPGYAVVAWRILDDPRRSRIVRRVLSAPLACIAFRFAWATGRAPL